MIEYFCFNVNVKLISLYIYIFLPSQELSGDLAALVLFVSLREKQQCQTDGQYMLSNMSHGRRLPGRRSSGPGKGLQHQRYYEFHSGVKPNQKVVSEKY